MIQMQNVSKCYGDFLAVDDLSFSIGTGSITALLGPNGAGKTTTMRMMTGYFPPTAGSVAVDGVDIRKDPLRVKRRIGYLPESAPLYGEMMVFDYLAYVAAMRKVSDPEAVGKAAEICGLREVMHRNIGELSRGYRQRVGLAHAMIHDPEVLVLDEPTAGLDPNQIIEVRDLIRKIGRVKTIVISTHILPEAEALCERVIIINQGRKVADSPVSELGLALGKGTVVRVKLKGGRGASVLKALRELPGVSAVNEFANPEGLSEFAVTSAGAEDLRPRIARLVADRGWDLYEMVGEKSSLEEVFRSLTIGTVDGAADADPADGAGGAHERG
jgi:ABC-2 type transport system ATP-binding protein